MKKEGIGGTKEILAKTGKFAKENPGSVALHALTLVIAGLLVTGSWSNAIDGYTNGGSAGAIGTILIPSFVGELLAVFTLVHFVNEASNRKK